MLIPKEQCRVQPLATEGRAASSLPHARLARTPSISSQSSLDSGTSRATKCAMDGFSTIDTSHTQAAHHPRTATLRRRVFIAHLTRTAT
ncbi:hypothetical protein SFRURICE_002123 [Spodoptera frugiperda]|nr:hypothetical protein SFRURICE_002123 [Spodoptera frugiperda]